MKRFLLGLVMALPILCFAQADFQKGYVVTNSKDTLSGYIDYSIRWTNPSSFEFKPLNRTAESRFFTLKDCSAFAFDEKPPFRRYIVNISMIKKNGKVVPGFESGSKRDTAFLQILQEGKNVTLFRYRDSLKKRFYILESGNQEPIELVNQSNDKSDVVTSNHEYINQIRGLLQKFSGETNAYSNKLSNLKYSESDLITIIAGINNNSIPKSQFSRVRFFFGAGFVGAKAGYQSLYRGNLTSLDAKFNFNPMVTFGVDFFNDPQVGQIIYRIEASVSKNEYRITRNFDQLHVLSNEHSFDQLNFSLHPQGIYNVYNTDKVKLFVGAGLAFNFVSTKKNETFIKYRWETDKDGLHPYKADLNNYYLSMGVKAGITLSKRFEFAAGYHFPNYISDETKQTARTLRLGFNYLLSNKK